MHSNIYFWIYFSDGLWWVVRADDEIFAHWRVQRPLSVQHLEHDHSVASLKRNHIMHRSFIWSLEKVQSRNYYKNDNSLQATCTNWWICLKICCYHLIKYQRFSRFWGSAWWCWQDISGNSCLNPLYRRATETLPLFACCLWLCRSWNEHPSHVLWDRDQRSRTQNSTCLC